jgi:exopolyphosphatase/guanosine-5'-triphosphate,3'-diphosphate pyrophosphatase
MTLRRCAFFDIGSNTVICLIAELAPDGNFSVLEDMAEITRLGRSVDATRRIAPPGERATTALLERYLRRCRELAVEETVAAGTSALRDAENSGEVRARWRAQLGLEVRVLSGDEEAAYSFLAVQKGLRVGARELLVADIGGGSTEFIRGSGSGVQDILSLDLGSVRLTERFLRHDPPHPAEIAGLQAAVDAALAFPASCWRRGATALTLVGVAGTFTTLAAVEKELVRYSHSQVHGSRLTRGEVRRQIDLFAARSLAQRQQIPGLEPRRADVILAGAVLIDRLMAALDSDHVLVSDQGVRYGLLHERLNRERAETI